METTKLSSKGQVIIPKTVRDAHGWMPGAEFIVEDTPQGVFLKPKKLFPATRLEDGLGCAGYQGPPLSQEEIDRRLEEDIRRQWGQA
jgi:AbrB family looped-hinge helix DNA binding protein